MFKRIRRRWGLIVGPSGVGKGYGIGAILLEFFMSRVFVTGDWCREHQREFSENGILVDDELITRACFGKHEILVQDEGHDQFHYFIDAPRSLKQAKDLTEWFLKQGCPNLGEVLTFHIHAEPVQCIERIVERAKRHNRLDDADPETVMKRLGFYFGDQAEGSSFEKPCYTGQKGVLNDVVPWLKSNTSYHAIDGMMDIDKIRAYVQNSLGPATLGTS